MQLHSIKKNVIIDLNAVDHLINISMHSEVTLVKEISKHIITSGGKRLRPLLVLLSAKACEYTGSHQINMAAVIEFIHAATLLHDDVIDNSILRRGCKTVNNHWGNSAAILVGDFLYSRAFQLMTNINKSKIMHIIANATNTIAEGEVLQLMNKNNQTITEMDYLKIIRSKTAKLFEVAAEIGPILSTQSHFIQNAFAKYGLHLGTAYQVIDDLLDYKSNTEILGKNIGNDLTEGKFTLPLIYLLQYGTKTDKKMILKTLAYPNKINIANLQSVILNSKAIGYTRKFAEHEIQLAITALKQIPKNICIKELISLANYIIYRDH